MTGEQAGAAHGAERVNPLGVFRDGRGAVALDCMIRTRRADGLAPTASHR